MVLSKTVLVAEDDSVSRLILEALLEKWEFEVLVASDGVEALRLAMEEKPALIILDWVMPGMDGLELCRRLRADKEAFATQPYVITLSSRSSCEDKSCFLEAGADDYLTKPFDVQELKARVKAAWRRLNWRSDPHPSPSGPEGRRP